MKTPKDTVKVTTANAAIRYVNASRGIVMKVPTVGSGWTSTLRFDEIKIVEGEPIQRGVLERAEVVWQVLSKHPVLGIEPADKGNPLDVLLLGRSL